MPNAGKRRLQSPIHARKGVFCRNSLGTGLGRQTPGGYPWAQTRDCVSDPLPPGEVYDRAVHEVDLLSVSP